MWITDKFTILTKYIKIINFIIKKFFFITIDHKLYIWKIIRIKKNNTLLFFFDLFGVLYSNLLLKGIREKGYNNNGGQKDAYLKRVT
jgi:hypothetical protein